MSMTKFEHTFTPGQSLQINTPGSFIRIISATGPVFVTPDTGNRLEIENRKSWKTAKKFERLHLESDTAQTVIGYLGDGEITDDSIGGNIAIGSPLPGSNTPDYGAVTLVAATATVIAAANTNRNEILIQNLTGSDIYIGSDSSVTNLNGIKVPNNGQLTTRLTSAIYGYSTPGGDVRFLEEGNV